MIVKQISREAASVGFRMKGARITGRFKKASMANKVMKMLKFELFFADKSYGNLERSMPT
jgi:hypothetical protein